MKATIVPAQFTTVEDRIISSLGLTQIMLLCVPLFISALLYVVFPPFLRLATYKLIVAIVFGLMCVVLSLRVRGILVLRWLVTILHFTVRPHIYVFDKCSIRGRELYLDVVPNEVETAKRTQLESTNPIRFDTTEFLTLHNWLESQAANIVFEIGKGGNVYARTAKAKKES